MSGRKIFTDYVRTINANPTTYLTSSMFKRGTIPTSSNCYWTFGMYDQDGLGQENQVVTIYQRLEKDTADQYLLLQIIDGTKTGIPEVSDMYAVELVRTTSFKTFRPVVDNTLSLGMSGRRWTQVWAATGTIQTSDERAKSFINKLPDSVLDAWGELDFHQFKFKDAVEEKGESNSRLHVGMIAQEIDRTFKSHNLNISDYGLFCFDSWEEKPEDVSPDGSILYPGQSAGDAYSLRYEEALCMEAAYQRRENRRLKEKVASLEERLANLESRLNIS